MSGITVRLLGDDSDLSAKLNKSRADVGKWAAASAAAAAAVGAAMVRSGLQSADALAKQAQQLQTTSRELAGMKRAADMAGVSQGQLDSAMRNLNQRLGQAVDGTGATAEALDKLGLSAESLAALPLDQRIATINQSIRDTIPAAQQAAVAAEFFGRQSAQAMALLDGDTIASAVEQVDKYNAALSETDAAMIEAANDAMSELSLIFTAVTQQLAVQFAPLLQGIAELLGDTAAEGDKIGTAVDKAFSMAVTAAGTLGDALRGIQIILKGGELAFWGLSAASTAVFANILKGFDFLMNSMKDGINVLIDGFNTLPYVEIDKLVTGESMLTARMSEAAAGTAEKMREIASEMHELAMQELPSEALETWVEASTLAAQEAAARTIEARQHMGLALVEIETDTQDKMTEEDEKAVAARIALAEKERRAKIAAASAAFGNLSSLMATENKKLFAIGKTAAIAQATIDGYAAIQSSYAQGAKIGGPVVGAAFAATAGIATAVQIAGIKSTSMGGGGGVPASGTGSGTPAIPNQQQVATGGAQQERIVRLEGLDPNSLYSGEQLTNLANSLVELQNDGFRLIPT